ncbi:MAG TPA: hypothetical protein ENN03_10300 [bacterium]|nr:hypothetical protein [bacterium]
MRKMKQRRLGILLPAVLLWAVMSDPALSQGTHRVERVIDGDTVELKNGERVRLIGINTPETVHPFKSVEFFGKEAGEFTRRLAEGKRVRIVTDVQERDRYGRLLAYVFLEDGTFLNAELLKQGYATVSTHPPNVKYVKLFRKLERQARKKGIGLWGKR